MRFATILLCTIALALTFSSTAPAAEKKVTAYEGYIVKLPDNTIVFEVPQEKGPAQRRIFYVGDQTTIIIDGKPGTHRDLATGMIIRLTPKTSNIAKSVEAITPKRKKW